MKTRGKHRKFTSEKISIFRAKFSPFFLFFFFSQDGESQSEVASNLHCGIRTDNPMIYSPPGNGFRFDACCSRRLVSFWFFTQTFERSQIRGKLANSLLGDERRSFSPGLSRIKMKKTKKKKRKEEKTRRVVFTFQLREEFHRAKSFFAWKLSASLSFNYRSIIARQTARSKIKPIFF